MNVSEQMVALIRASLPETHSPELFPIKKMGGFFVSYEKKQREGFALMHDIEIDGYVVFLYLEVPIVTGRS